MTYTRVKICGITSPRDLKMCVEAGVDALGFVVGAPKSPRNLALKHAKRLIRATPDFVKTVAVTVPEDLDQLERFYLQLKPDILQVHGLSHMHRETRSRLPDSCLIGAIPVKSQISLDQIIEAAESFNAILLDSYSPEGYGGTGKTHDWQTSSQVREAIHPQPLILAGGLTPKNVKKAIKSVKPYAVDVSSGVESIPGVKDDEKVYEFIEKTKQVEIR